MNRFILFFALPLLFFTTPSVAGHGGGHGGGGHHGGGHGGGYRGGGHHNGFGGGDGYTGGERNAGHSMSGSLNSRFNTTPRNRTLPGGYYGPTRNLPYISHNNGYTPGYGSSNGRYYGEHGNSNPYYSYPGYAPLLSDPYFNMYSVGMGFANTPNYAPGPSGYTPLNNSNNPSEEELDGYVVFEHDTISGAITIKNNAVMVETADTARAYDYKLKTKNTGLEYVTVYNDDDKQLHLVRLKDEPKKLWRLVHHGKMNMYDERRDFIYKPEDIDARTLVVVYNGEIVHIHARSMDATKQRLTALVNKVYGTDLDPQKYTWKQLLIYIDKLD